MIVSLLCGLAHAGDLDEAGVRAGLGLGVFVADSNEYINTTWTAVPRLGYHFNSRWALELDVGLGQGLSDLSRTYWFLSPRLNAVVHGPQWGAFQPFVAAGPGLLRQKENRSEDISEPTTNGAGYGLFENPDTDFLLNIGPGLLLGLGDSPWSLRTDLRYLANIGSEPHGAKASDIFHDLEWTIGVSYKPIREPSDRDLDGLIDEVDGCPDEPEDVDSYQDSDGCPDPDNDADGILDGSDECPNDPEDMDGFEDADGCPDPDNDDDGILDGSDECPDEPETANNYQDADGCPDEIPVEEVKKFTGVIQGITFELNSDVIRASSEVTLQAALVVLQEFDEVRLEVQGHTDDQGADDYNQDLSQRRSESVVAWFVDNGIDAGRLVARGYGESQPIADNSSTEGKAQNRRVEFQLIQ